MCQRRSVKSMRTIEVWRATSCGFGLVREECLLLESFQTGCPQSLYSCAEWRNKWPRSSQICLMLSRHTFKEPF